MHFTSLESSVLDRAGLRRVAGTTAHPIEFGVFCAMVLPLAIHVAFRAARSVASGFWWTCVGLIAHGLMFSVSRSAILAVPVRRTRPPHRLAGPTAGVDGRRRGRFLVVIKFASPGLLGTFLSLFQNAGRTAASSGAPMTTPPPGTSSRSTSGWAEASAPGTRPKHEVFDNQYLLTLVDSGVLGLVSFVGIFVAAMYAAVRVCLLRYRSPTRQPCRNLDRDLALSLVAALAVILPTFATFDFVAFPTVSSLAFLLVGIAAALLRIVSRRGGRRTARPLRHRLTAVGRSPAGVYPSSALPATAPRVHRSSEQGRDR